MTDRKKILLVSNGFFPEISPRSYRATELAREFSREGHSVTIITKYRDYDYELYSRENNVLVKTWSQCRFPRIQVGKSSHFSLFGRILARVLLTLFEYPGIEEMFKVRNILSKEDNYDLLISFAVPYPIHWGVAWSRSVKHKLADTWVADCGDPYMGDVLDTFRKPFYFGLIEKWFCRNADYISIPIESAKPAYYKEFHHKIRIIPQGFDFCEEQRATKKPENSVPVFAYSGSFLPGTRDPVPLLNFLITLDRPFQFYIFTNKPDLLSGFEEKLRGKLFISNYIPRDKLLKFLAGTDFLVNFDNNTSYNSPSKLIDYAIVNRPVLNIKHDFQGMDIIEFLAGDYSKRMITPEISQYHIKEVAGLFLELLPNDNV